MLRSLCLAVAATVVIACGTKRPSVLLVTVDTLREDAVGAFGNSRARTPHMDELAAEGVRFTDARSAVPLTLPSHLTILSGLYPAQHGIRVNDPERAIPPRRDRGYPLLAEELGDLGYATAAFVSSSVLSSRTGIAAGFTTFDEPGETVPGALRFETRLGGETVKAASGFLKNTRTPFFLWVHLFDPHEPYEPPLAFRSGAPPDSPAAYADEVTYADWCVGRLLAALKSSGHEDDTLVILTADHGEGLSEHKEPTHGYCLFDTTLRVPLLVRWPGHVTAGSARDDPVSLVRIAPTIRAAVGLSPHGRSLLLPAQSPPQPVFSETLYGYRSMRWAQVVSVVDGQHKLVQGPSDRDYDLASDPGEKHPGPQAPARLLAEIKKYKALRPIEPKRAGSALTPLRGLPYASSSGGGQGSGFLPEKANRHLPWPDPGLARELDRIEARVGKDDRVKVRRDLLALARRDPKNPTICFWLGRNEMASAPGSAPDPSAAADRFGEAFAKGLTETKVLDLWLQQLILAKRFPDAREVLRGHLAKVVPDAGTFVMEGVCLLRAGKLEEARRCADRADRVARTRADRELVSRFRHNLGQKKEQ